MASSKKPKYSKTKTSSSASPSPLSSATPARSGVKSPSYTGNPTQPHMARSSTSGIRYIAAHSRSTGLVQGPAIHVEYVLTTGSITYDTPINVEDVTGDQFDSDFTTGTVPQINANFEVFNIYYVNMASYYGVDDIPHSNRDIKVTFQSGHTQTLTVFLPGKTTNFDAVYNASSLTYTPSFDFIGCDFHKWNDGFYHSASGLVGLDYTKYISTNSDNDPAGIFPPGNPTHSFYSNFTSNIYFDRFREDYISVASSAYQWYPEVGVIGPQTWELLHVSKLGNQGSPGTIITPASILSSTTYDDWYMRHVHLYAENLPSCSATTTVIDGCTDPNNMAYWGYTGNDCNDDAIPSSIQANPSLATWTPGSCCPDCINPLGDDITISTQPLTLNVQGTNPTAAGITDGFIDVTILDQGFDTSGIPQGLPTGTANYTFVLENTDASDTMCGNSAGVKIGSGATTNTKFTFGYLVLPNANGGLLQTGATGSATYVASSAQGYVPAAAGTTNNEGLRAGTYNVYVYDSNSTAVCLAQTQVTLTAPAPVIGCTDTNSLSYDATANINSIASCHYCSDGNGTLIDGNDDFVSVIASSTSAPTITYPTSSVATDGAITLTGLSATGTFQAYINNIVDSSNIQNADYKIELYKWNAQVYNGNATWSTTNLLTSFNAGTTQVGSTINNQGNGWNVTLNSSTLGATFLYGYYTVKVYVDDPDSTSEQEQCYELFDVIVPVPACVDAGLATTSDGVVISDVNLYIHDSTLCATVPPPCCDTITFTQSSNSTTCAIEYEVELNCSTTAPDAVTLTLQFYDGASWVDVNTPGGILYMPNPGANTNVTFAQSVFQFYGSGQYKVKVVSEFSGYPNCVKESLKETVTLGIFGCTDPTALNYDATANCITACTYCVYGCTNPTAINYNPLATCDDGSCAQPVAGCTDMTASNYNPAAVVDDGSCIYLNCGCTDPLAYNYGYNVAGTLVGTPPPCDDGNCQYCPTPALTVSSTTHATTLVSPTGCLDNCDGTINLTVTSAGCSTYTIVSMYTFCGIVNTNLYVLQNQNYSTGTTSLTNLCSATYTLILEDCNGCQMQVEVTVPGPGGPCGCTDPAADNYNSSATTDDGSCEYCGCTDDGAINYNPGATSNCTPDTCEYPPMLPPCIPPSIDQTLYQIQACIADNGFDYYNKILIGKTDDCSNMNVWKLILIDHLLKKKGLDCIYNCADANTPNAADVYISCEALWIQGGTTTGLADGFVNTLIPAVGTTSTAAMFDLSSTTMLFPGDVIKHHASGNIWIFYGPGQGSAAAGVSVAGLDPENASGNASGYWGYCNDNMRYISNTNNINYIDNFINFVNTFCADCKNDLNAPITTSTQSLRQIQYKIGNNLDEIDDIEI